MRYAVILAAIGLAGCEAPQTQPSEDVEATEVAAVEPVETSGVTMANFSKLSTGMTYEQVVEILGEHGEEISSNEIAGIRTVMYMWEGGSMGANMNAMFQNDKMMQKSQFGLD